MPRVTFSADDTVSLGTVDPGHRGFSIKVESGGNLGGGTLTLQSRPGEEASGNETIDTLALGDQFTYELGEGAEGFLDLSGSSSPDVYVDVAQI